MRTLLVFIFFPFVVVSQNDINDWIGDYSGELILGFANRPNDTIPVKFEMHEIVKDSAWTYRMHYDSKVYGKMTKDYVIRAKKLGESKHFLLDELNGIIMEMTMMNNCLYGMYEVADNIFVSTIRGVDKNLLIDLICAPLKNPSVTSTEVSEEGDKIDAISYKPTLHQTVLLRKDD